MPRDLQRSIYGLSYHSCSDAKGHIWANFCIWILEGPPASSNAAKRFTIPGRVLQDALGSVCVLGMFLLGLIAGMLTISYRKRSYC